MNILDPAGRIIPSHGKRIDLPSEELDQYVLESILLGYDPEEELNRRERSMRTFSERDIENVYTYNITGEEENPEEDE